MGSMVARALLLGYGNNVKGMTEEVARRSIDWLYDARYRVLALMGGEVLGKASGCTSPHQRAANAPGRDRPLTRRGVATFNLAVDSVPDRRELPKALDPIRPYFDYLIKEQYVYGFSVFFQYQHHSHQPV